MAHIVDGQSFGPYTIISRLGRGGMASVYRAYEARLDRTVALKVLPDDLLNQPGFLDRFEREARVIARLEHPHIVPVYASGIDEGQPWMALRLVRGGNLADWLEQGRSDQDGLDRDTGLRYLACIADALDFAHAQGIVHRDLKPQNILLGERDECYIADFGIASLLSAATRLTQTGAALGTPQYMAPEQVTGKTVGPTADLYALGVIAYRWLSGELPFNADTPYAVMYKHVSAPLPLEPLRNQPVRVQEVLARMLAKQPEDRWASAGAFVRALTAALIESAQAAPIDAHWSNTAPPPQHTPPPVTAPGLGPAPDSAAGPRRSIGGWLAALVAVLVIALGDWAAYRWMQPSPALVVEPVPPPPAVPESVSFAGLTLGNAIDANQNVTAATTSFVPTDTIYAAVETKGAASNAVIVAKWTYGDGQFVNENSHSITTTSGAVTMFRIAKPDGWPVGKYKVDITLDGNPVANQAFEVARVTGAKKAENGGFEDLGNGSLRDTKTELVWTQADNGRDINWDDAMSYCANKGVGWSLPTVAQLQGIYDSNGNGTSCGAFTCKVSSLFRLTSEWFWSSERDSSSSAFFVDLAAGLRASFPVSFSSPGHALCVRRRS